MNIIIILYLYAVYYIFYIYIALLLLIDSYRYMLFYTNQNKRYIFIKISHESALNFTKVAVIILCVFVSISNVFRD